MSQKDYFILSSIDVEEGSTWQDWQANTVKSEENIIGVFKTPSGAHVGIMSAIQENNTRGYVIQVFCVCCGKHSNPSVIWFDPSEQQLFGAL